MFLNKYITVQIVEKKLQKEQEDAMFVLLLHNKNVEDLQEKS